MENKSSSAILKAHQKSINLFYDIAATYKLRVWRHKQCEAPFGGTLTWAIDAPQTLVALYCRLNL